MKLAPLILLILALPVCADALLRENIGQKQTRLMATPCRNLKVIRKLKPETAGKFRRAVVTARYGTVEGCWVADPEGIYLRLEDGQTRQLPFDFDVWERDYGA